MNDTEDIEKIKKIANLTRDEVGHTEENVKLKIVVPLLVLLGHKREDLEFEYRTNKGRKIDIFIKNVPRACKVIIDTKNYDADLTYHIEQIREYTSEESAFLAILVNGSEIRIYSPIIGIAFKRSLLYVIERQKLTDKKWWNILLDVLGKENLQNGNASKTVEKRKHEIDEALSSEEHLEQECRENEQKYKEKIGYISKDIEIKKEEMRQLNKQSETSSNELKIKINEIWQRLELPGHPRILQRPIEKRVGTSGTEKTTERVKVYMYQLVDAGFLKDGQTLYFCHRHQRYDEQAQVIASLTKLKYSDGNQYSPSKLAEILLKKHGLTRSTHGVAGPKYWVTEDDTSLDELNDQVR